jgi:hypothetical protein
LAFSCKNVKHSVCIPCILFQYLVSTNPEASDCNSYCLLLCPSLDSVPEMVLVNPRRVPTPLSADATFWTSWFAPGQVVYTMPQ